MNVTPSSDPDSWWLAGYQSKWLAPDLLAGFTLAAYAIPVSLAYATLAGLPPQMGLYCYLVGGLGYVLFGSSRHLAIGPTSAISLVFGVTIAQMAGGDADRLLSLAALATLMTAGLFVLAWLLRLSVIVNFISDSILTGFKAGAALAIIVTQLPRLFGVPGGGTDFFSRLMLIVRQLGDTNSAVLAVGVAAVVLLALGDKLFPGRPVALVVVVVSLVAVPLLALPEHGISVVGQLPAGLPSFDLAHLGWRDLDAYTWRQLVSLTFACFLLSYIESISAARTFALKYHYEVDARQELLGLGAANLLAGLFQGYPSAGGLSQSAVNEKAGARTPLALVFASVTLGLVLLFLTGLFRNLPNTVLAAVVLVAVLGLIDVRELRHLFRVSRLDFAVAVVALAGVLLLGILDGVVFAVVASLVMLLQRTSTPHVAFLGRIPGTNRFSDLARHPENEPVPGVLIFRVEAALLYFNVDHVQRTVLERVRSRPEGLHVVICDLSNSPYLDLAGVRMLARLYDELKMMNIELLVVEAHATQRDILRAEGLDKLVGPIHREISLADTLADLKNENPLKTT
ncbi:MAG: SulP family inorganic anion transporter [Limisphaerales bacterium]